MNRIYRITLILLLLILLLANVAFFVSDGQLISYLNIETELESSQEIIDKARADLKNNPEKDFFDLSILESDKFNNLKEFEFSSEDISDLDNFIPGGEQNGTNTGEMIIPDDEHSFEVGNPNPFDPIF
ncbi:MAG: hypothetical protein PHP37_02615 [Patescibacteria group bacterium]|nr:hypothetical protein [Patescibacteria group bacterium]